MAKRRLNQGLRPSRCHSPKEAALIIAPGGRPTNRNESTLPPCFSRTVALFVANNPDSHKEKPRRTGGRARLLRSFLGGPVTVEGQPRHRWALAVCI